MSVAAETIAILWNNRESTAAIKRCDSGIPVHAAWTRPEGKAEKGGAIGDWQTSMPRYTRPSGRAKRSHAALQIALQLLRDRETRGHLCGDPKGSCADSDS